jgi:hypothetical protein
MHSRWNHGSPDEARRQARAAEGYFRQNDDMVMATITPMARRCQLAAADHDILRTLG